MRRLPIALIAALLAPLAAWGQGTLENPVPGNPFVSGVGLISGWHCTASRIDIEFDGAVRSVAPIGSDRLDTAGACGGKRNTGFGLLFNWGVLSPGTHTVKAFADGVEIGSRTVSVVDMGGQFLTGRVASAVVDNFPDEGRQVVLEWQQGLQAFIPREVRDYGGVSGTWNGANLERRTNCTASQNNGSRGTYAQWVVTRDSVGDQLRIQETGITGLSCTYSGPYRLVGNQVEWYDGTYSCTDGKTGNFHSTEVFANRTALSIRLAIKLTGSESCDIDAIIGGSRF